MSRADAIFEEHRASLTRLAYRMLGTQADADEVMQEAYLRWARRVGSVASSAGLVEPDAPRAYLAAIVTNLSIDRRRDIETRKEQYIGPWLPEPIVEPVDSGLETAESVSMALLVVLESLSPPERAAYLLRRVFDYGYDEMAQVLQRSEPACRQLVSRAEAHVQSRRPRFQPDPVEAERLTRMFLHACSSGNLNGLVHLLAADAVFTSDGGGKATAALAPIRGAERIARFFLGIFRKSPPEAKFKRVRVNGQPGVMGIYQGQVVNVLTFDVVDGKIAACFAIRNPDKLKRVEIDRNLDRISPG